MGDVIDLPPGGRTPGEKRDERPLAQRVRADKITKARLDRDVSQLLLAGLTVEAITEALSDRYRKAGLPAVTVNRVRRSRERILTQWARQTADAQETLVDTINQRYDKLLQSVLPRATQTVVVDVDPETGARRRILNPNQLKAIDRVLSIERERRKLLGLDAPEKKEVTATVRLEGNITKDEVDAEEQLWQASAGQAIDIPECDVVEDEAEMPELTAGEADGSD